MNPIVIPPSPSWYLSKVINSRSDGTIAYGARHEVVVIKCKSEDFSFEKFEISFIPLAHKDRINSIVFSPSNCIDEFKNSLATCSDDGTVRIWDFETEELKLVNSIHQDGQKVIDVDWSSADPSLVVAVADSSTLMCWDILSNVARRINMGFKINPTCVAACPHDKMLVAVGARGGIILIFNLKGTGDIQNRMRSHESDIVSLSWCPAKHNIFQEKKGDGAVSRPSNGELEVPNGKLSLDDGELSRKESNKENDIYLLASGSKDRLIYFWRAGTDGRYEAFVTMSHQPLSTGFRRKTADKWDKTGSSSWVCVRWIDPYTLISGSPFGELLEWDLTKVQPREKEREKSVKNKKAVSQPVKLLHGNHTKGLYCVACPDLPTRPDKKDENRHIWTTAVDKKLICTSLKTGKVTAEITTIGGIVYCLAVSPLDPNRIAIGIGDSKILIWNMASEKTSMTVLWQRVNGKVMALEWHPTDEKLLAFGTGEGRVGLFDVSSSKPPIIFRQYHRRSVYRLCWAPHLVKPDNQTEEKVSLALFSVGDGDVLQMNLDTPDAEPINLKEKFIEADRESGSNKPIGRTDILWKPDRSVLALGNENGVIYIFDGKTLVKKHLICAHKKLVQSLRWHPSSVTSDAAGLSPCHNWLATASDVLKVFDVQADSSKEVAVFNLQKEKIVDVSWSPHINGRLVSVSYDYTVQVWDVINKAPWASYLSHHNAVLTAVWSPLDPDIIISGSADNTLRVWRVSAQTDKRPSEKRKTKINNRLKKMANVPEAVDVTKEKISSAVAPSSNNTSKNESDIIKECITSQSQKIKGKSLFPVSGTAMNLAKHVKEHFQQWKESKSKESTATATESVLNGNGTCSPTPLNKDTGYLDFFSDGNAMRRLLMAEEAQLAEMGHQQQLRDCMLWRGDITEMIQEAIQKKQLTPYLVALAPMASVRIWKDACSVYAEQLSSQGEHMRGAGFLIAIHKVEEAVQLLADNKLYREAIALAKCRLPSNDPLIKTVMNDFANYSLNNGQLHLAAHCFLSLDEPLTASQTLARCKDLSSVRLAALLALEANAQDIAINLAKSCFRAALIASDFDTCVEILNEHPGLKFLNVWANASKFINESVKPDMESQFNWIKGNTETEESSEMIIDRIRQDAKSYPNCYETLRKSVTSFIQLDTEKQLWLYISCELTLAGTADSNLVSLRHLVKAMASVYKYQMLNGGKELLFRLCMLLFPKGPMSQENLSKHQENYGENEKNLISSINSYLFAGIFGWLSDNIKNISENLKEGEAKDFEWLKEFISFFRFDLFNSKNVEYFKNVKMIEDLEHKIALSKCITNNEKIEGRVILTAVRKQNKPKSNVSSPKVENDGHKKSTNANGKEDNKTDRANHLGKENSTRNECNLKIKEEVVDEIEKNESKKDNTESIESAKGGKCTETIPAEVKSQIKEEVVVKIEKTEAKKDNVETNDCAKGGKCTEITPTEVKSQIKEKVVVKIEKTEAKKDNIETNDYAKGGKCTEITPTEVKSQIKEKVVVKIEKTEAKKVNVETNDCVKEEKRTEITPVEVKSKISDEERNLSCIKEFNVKFESERISVPNPFSSFFEVLNVVQSLTKDAHPDLYQDVEHKLQEAWKTANETCK